MSVATLTVSSNDPDEGLVPFSLSGNGVVPTITLITPGSALNVNAKGTYMFSWDDEYSPGDAAISIYLDDDTDPDNGFIMPIVEGISENSTGNSYYWQVPGNLARATYNVFAKIDAGGVVSVSYATGDLSVENSGMFSLLSPQQVTDSNYAYQYVYDGSTYGGTQVLTEGVNLVSVVTPDGNGGTVNHEIEVFYDTKKPDEDGFTYDRFGRIETSTNGNGIVSQFSYDSFGRPEKIEYSNGKFKKIEYDLSGRVTEISNKNSSIFYTYDDLDRVTTVVTSRDNISGNGDDRKIGYTYDLAGRLTQLTYPGGGSVGYDYDAAGRTIAVNDNTGISLLRTAYLYDPVNGQLNQATLPNGVTKQYTYDGAGRLTDIEHKSSSGSLISRYHYKYNIASLKSEMSVTSPDPDNPGATRTRKEKYTYDGFGQITRAVYSDDENIDPADRIVTNTYDRNGNRISMSVSKGGSIVEDYRYSYDQQNRLIQMRESVENMITSFAYDGEGNLVLKETPGEAIHYEYDEANLLTRVVGRNRDVQFEYDATGDRIAKIVSGVRTEYVVEPISPISQVLEERDSIGNVAVHYTYGFDRISYTLLGEDDPVYYLSDGLGSTDRLVDSDETVTKEYQYDVFGELISSSTNNAERSLFNAASVDQEIDLINLYNRFLSSKTGRFVTKGSGLNGYVFEGNSPVNLNRTRSNILPPFSSMIFSATTTAVSLLMKPANPLEILFFSLESFGLALADDILSDSSYGLKSPYAYAAWKVFSSPIDLMFAIHMGGTGLLGVYIVPFVIGAQAGLALGDIPEVRNFIASLILANSGGMDPLVGVANLLFFKLNPFMFGQVEILEHFLQQPLLPSLITAYKSTPGISGYVPNYFGNDRFLNRTNNNITRGQNNVVNNSNLNNNTNITPGGVLIDKAAELINGNLSDIRGATYDPESGQIIFLCTDDTSSVKDINMDYFYTAVQAVYGSAVPPFVTLDPPAYKMVPLVDMGNKDGVWEPDEIAEMFIRLNPIWNSDADDMRIKFRMVDDDVHQPIAFDADIDAYVTISGERTVTELDFAGWLNAPDGLDVVLFESIFNNYDLLSSPKVRQDSIYRLVLRNNSATHFTLLHTAIVTNKQHRKFGGRVDGTRLGWVMYEADRVMKCLTIGRDTLTSDDYDSTTVPVEGFENIFEKSFAEQYSSSGGETTRLWFMPDEMNLKQYLDEVTGQTTVVFDSATVVLKTEAFISGEASSPKYQSFVDHFNAHYDDFSALEFPVQDPDDPTGETIIRVRIFEMLKEVMQAVSLARFLKDNNIPLDMWWLNSWKPPTAYSPKMIDTAYREFGNTGWNLMYGGVEINKINEYFSSTEANSLGSLTTSERPEAANGGDIREQYWELSSPTEGDLKAVAVSMEATNQDNSLQFPQIDLSFASPGSQNLSFIRYYNSAYLRDAGMGPGWDFVPFRLEFSRPSWFDEQGLMRNEAELAVWSDDNWNTRLRSGEIRLTDGAGGSLLNFASSLRLSYSTGFLGNPLVTINGLDENNLPQFTPGELHNGAILNQNSNDYGYTLTYPLGAEMAFDHEGRLLSITDQYDNTISYGYNEENRLVYIRDSAGRQISVSYNSQNLVSSVVGPQSEQMSFGYDAKGRLVSATHIRSGATTTYNYNGVNQLVSETPPDGVVNSTISSDLRGRVTGEQDVYGNQFSFSYGVDADTLQHTTTMTDVGSGIASGSSRTFDRYGRIVSTNDQDGNVVDYGYYLDSLYPNSISSPLPGRSTVSIDRNANGQPVKIVDPDIVALGGQPTIIEYNELNQPVKVTDVIGRVTEYHYNNDNDLDKVIRYLGATPVETTIISENGYPVSITDPTGRTLLTVERDEFGRVIKKIDGAGIQTTYSYDTLGRLEQVVVPGLSSPVIYTYNNADQVTSIQTPSGTIRYEYYPDTGRLKATTGPDGSREELVYDPVTKDVVVTKQIPPEGEAVVTTYQYDSRGQVSKITLPEGGEIEYVYNNMGQLITKSDQERSIVWVDFTYAGTESGTQDRPFNTLTEAINAVVVGGEIIIKRGITSKTFTGINKIKKKVTIKSSGGTAVIGKQP